MSTVIYEIAYLISPSFMVCKAGQDNGLCSIPVERDLKNHSHHVGNRGEVRLICSRAERIVTGQ